MSQKEFASYMGVARDSIRRWLRKENKPTEENARLLQKIEYDILTKREIFLRGTLHCGLPKGKINQCYASNGCYYHRHCEIAV
jgi:transcriptional regulator with XRE-family HTH domain